METPKKRINIQNDDNKCFLWCHIRHLNSVDKSPQRITKEDKEFVDKLNYEGISFPVSRKDYSKIEVLIKICINTFCYENKTVYLVYLSDQKFDNNMDLLLILGYYVRIKNFNRLMFNKAKNKNKKCFCKSCLRCFSSNKVLNEHRKDCLIVNIKQNVKLESGFISFKNYSRQIPVPFKIYADFECILKSCDIGINTRKYQNHVPCNFAYNDEYNYCRRITRKHFCKNLIMTAEENEKFELANICWICDGLIENCDNKIRDHKGHVTGKYRGAAHYSCNINLKISNKVPVIFDHLKGYNSHLTFKELSRFNGLKIDVIPNGLEKYMTFTLNKNLVFIDSMLFMNSSLDKLVKNLSDKDFKYLSLEFSGEELRLEKRVFILTST